MKCKKAIVTLMAAGILFTGCGLKSQKAIIKVNNSAITQEDFDNLMDLQIANNPFAKMGGAENFKKDKNGMLYLMTEQRVLNQLIIEKILDQEIKERGIKVSKKEVDKSISKIIEKIGGKDKLSELLKTNGVSTKQFRSDIEKQEKLRKLAESTGKTKVTKKDCEDFYKNNPDKFKQPEQVRASHILIIANPYQLSEQIKAESKKEISEKDLKAKVDAKIKEQKALAEKIAKELKADSSKFAKYAKKYSQDPQSAEKGGDLGFFAKERMVPEFSKAAFEAKPNTVTGVVQTQFGYHIIYVTDRKAAATIPYEKAKTDIKEFLTSDKIIKTLDDIVASAKKKSKIVIIDKDYDPEVIDKKLNKQMEGLKNELKHPQNAKEKKM